MVTLTFASAAQVAQVGPSALLWDEAADGYVARAAAVQKTGAVLHIGTTAASLLDIATGGFHGVQRDESEPSQGPVFDSAPCDPATWGTGWDAGATGLKDISISATGGAYASLGSGTVAGGIRVDSAAFDWSDILAPKVTIEVATRARLCGQFALGVKAPLPSAEKDLPVPTLGAVVDLGLVRAKVGFITTVGVSVAAKLEMGANVYVGADGVAAATWTRGQPLTSTVSFDPTGAVEDFAVESAGEGKIYAKPALQIGWGKPKAPGSLHVALGAEVGVKAKIESTLKNGKLNVCREASLYADALYELAPPFPDIESVEISKTLGETPLWSKPECKEGKAKVVLDKTEVTVAAYEACVAAGACVAAATAELCNWGVAGRGNHPINCVDSYQATAYCAWAGGRLPTGQEWEVAARGEEGRTYPWGEEEPGSRACWRGPGSGYGPNTPDGTCPVGAHPAGATPEGIEDMAGNVSEWTSGCTGSEGCPVGSTAWVCGGSWVHYDSSYLEGSVSFADKPDRIEIDVGFRCVRPE